MISKEIKHTFRDQILPPNHPASIYVKRVTARILKHSNLGHIRGETRSLDTDESSFGSNWTPEDTYATTTRETHGPEKEWDIVMVHDMEIVNASASPGWCKLFGHPTQHWSEFQGLITIYTGILPVCRDEEGLAAVLAHGH